MALPLALCSSQSQQDWLLSSVMGTDDLVSSQEYHQEPTIQLQQLICLGNHRHQYYQIKPSPHNVASSSCRRSLNMDRDFSRSFASELHKQKLEMDWYLQLENQKLRRAVMQEETRQREILLREYEASFGSLIQKKDADLEMARKKAVELQRFLAGAEDEVKAWERKAMESEAIAINLSNRINDIQFQQMECQSSNHAAPDAESLNGSSHKGGNHLMDVQENYRRKLACKLCHAQRMCFVFLPCRHLCSCRSCEAILQLCPVCESAKEGSIEVFLV